MVHAGDIDGLNSTFADYKKITIADYQRNYDWGKSEISDLWGDLLEVITSGKDHFFGSLILQTTGDKACELVDGQQRFTTVFLFVSRLRDEIHRLSVREIKASGAGERDIQVLVAIEDFLYGHQVKTTEPRFEPNTLLQTVGRAAFLPENPENRAKKIPKRSGAADREATLPFRNAYWAIADIVQKEIADLKDDETKLARLHQIAIALLEQLKVLTITTANSEESLDVFMTTNDRGLPLGVFDLVRGQVLKATTSGKSESEKKEIFVDTLKDWEEILINVEGSKPDQFLRHHLLSRTAQKITMKSVPSVTESEINFRKAGSATRAKDLWESVKISSGVYDELLRPSMPSPTKEHLEGLRMLADSYRVFALRVFHPEASLSPKEKAELTRLLWVSVVRWNMAYGNAQEFEGRLQTAAEPLWASGGYPEAKKRLTELASTEYDLEKYLADGVTAQTAKAILLAIETELSGKASTLDVSRLTIEHVAPQKSTVDWEAKLKHPKREYKELMVDIGNLTILDSGLNSSVKQDPFHKKVIDYGKSRSNITNDLAELQDWNTTIIEHRHQWLVESLKSLLEVQPQEIVHFSAWMSGSK